MKTGLLKITALAALAITLAPVASAATLSWEAGFPASGGGSGAWNSTSSVWYNGTSLGTWVTGDDALFDETSGTVTVSSAQSADSLTFNSSGYIITGSSLTLTGGSVNVVSGGSATIGSITSFAPNINVNGGGTLTLGAALTPATSATVNIGGGSLVIGQSSGTVSFSNGGTINGNLVIANSIRVNFGSLVGSTTAASPSVATYNGSGSIQIQSPFTIVSNVSGSYGGAIVAKIHLNSLNLPFTKTDVTQSNLAYPSSGVFSVALGATKNGNFNGYLSFNGVISGNSDVAFCTNSAVSGGGAAVTLLNAQNTYTGTTFLDGNGPEAGTGGSLILGASNALPVTTDLVFGFLTPSPSHNPELDLNGNNQQIGSLSMSSTANLPGNQSKFMIANNDPNTTATLTISGSKTPANPFGGIILDNSGSGGTIALVKSGPSTLTLSGSNTYSGGTMLDAGTLVAANSAGSATGLGTVTLNGGTLASEFPVGTIAGNVAAGSGPHAIAPGGLGNVGTLVLSGNLSLNGNSTLDFDVFGGSSDLLQISGPLSVSGLPSIAIKATGTLSGPYTLATYGSSSVNSSEFNVTGVPPGYTLTVSSNEVQLVAVPEPSTFVLLAIGALGLAAYFRRRRAG